jgi:putative endonuclease
MAALAAGGRRGQRGLDTPDHRHPGLVPGPTVQQTITSMIERLPCVYILASGYNGSLYIGVTSNLLARMVQHRDGLFDGHTRRYGIKRLVWFETTDVMDAAITREKQLKRWRRDWKRNLIERENPEWNDLAPMLGLDPLG